MLVGCGKQKQETSEPVPARDLYTSPYFACKRRYAEVVSQPGDDAPDGTTGWTILSAEYDVLWPHIEVEPYETTIADLTDRPAPVAPDAYQHTRYPWDEPRYETALDFWARRVHFGLASWLGFKSGFPEEDPHCRRLIVLAGNDYVDPLLKHDVFEPFPWETWFPFQEGTFDGIGEQMAWLTEEIERLEQDESLKDGSREQGEIDQWIPRPDPDIERPDVDGQSTWEDWR